MREPRNRLDEFVDRPVWREIERAERAGDDNAQRAGGAHLGRCIEAGEHGIEQASCAFDTLPRVDGTIGGDRSIPRQPHDGCGRHSRELPVLDASNDVAGDCRRFGGVETNPGGRKIS
jgi:hypothetical protein